MNIDDLVIKLIDGSLLNYKTLHQQKRVWAKKYGQIPKNSQILKAYRLLLKNKKLTLQKPLENLLRLKKVRSLSGIVPVAVLTKPYPCPGQCIYCPTQKNMPKSYLNNEPAVMRAKMANFDPYLQVKRRLTQLKITGHATDKVELIVMGGTFSSLPKNYQIEFISHCFAACNGKKINNLKLKIKNYHAKLKILKQLQKENQTAKNRIVGLTLETRPDYINLKEIKFMRCLGATRVEIGVQSIYDKVLQKVKRGHLVKATIKATKLLKDAGFKVCYHLMPNLPGSTLQTDFSMFKTVFTNPDFMPDMIKIYPCVVTYQAKLYDWYKKAKFKPYSNEELINLLIKIKKIVPEWIRINRLGRDIPVNNIAAGFKISNIRQILHKILIEKNIQCQCIRCREIKNRKIRNLKLVINNYRASDGKEYFLQYIDKNNKLHALLRLRITKISKGVLGIPPPRWLDLDTLGKKKLYSCAIIRELHTYGQALAINKKNKQTVQHQGLGKQLIKKAEEITQNLGIKKITVISGVGAREYYRKLGYNLQNTYMVKTFY